jgi:hypothetical protein
MLYGNAAVVVIVISLVFCVLGLVFGGLYFLDKAVDPGATGDGEERKPAPGEAFRVHEIGKKAPPDERGAPVAPLRSEAR